MYETNLGEWEEYDSRIVDDRPFMHGTRSPNLPSQGYGSSAETYESPFLTDREAGGGAQEVPAAQAECECGRGQRIAAASSAETASYRESARCAESESDLVAAQSESVGAAEGAVASENAGELVRQTEVETEAEAEAWISELESFEADPYAPIRSAMSSEYAHLSAEEVSLTLGGTPARVVLHQLLSSPAAKQVALAALLGRIARRSVRIDGTDISIPGYLRIMSRLCTEVAQEYEDARRS